MLRSLTWNAQCNRLRRDRSIFATLISRPMSKVAPMKPVQLFYRFQRQIALLNPSWEEHEILQGTCWG